MAGGGQQRPIRSTRVGRDWFSRRLHHFLNLHLRDPAPDRRRRVALCRDEPSVVGPIELRWCGHRVRIVQMTRQTQRIVALRPRATCLHGRKPCAMGTREVQSARLLGGGRDPKVLETQSRVAVPAQRNRWSLAHVPCCADVAVHRRLPSPKTTKAPTEVSVGAIRANPFAMRRAPSPSPTLPRRRPR